MSALVEEPRAPSQLDDVASSIADADVTIVDNATFDAVKQVPWSVVGAYCGRLAGGMVFVDAVNGTSGGARGYRSKPFDTPPNAQTAASSSDLIHVYPGAYTLTAALGKDGVNWSLAPAVILNAVSTAAGVGVSVLSDGGAAKTIALDGFGQLLATGIYQDNDFSMAACVFMSDASSVFYVHAQSLTNETAASEDDSAVGGTVVQSGGLLYISADLIENDGENYGLWWFNGQMHVHASRLVSSSAGSIVTGTVTASPVGNGMFVHVDSIEHAGGICVYNASSQAEAKIWVDAPFISTTTSSPAVEATGGKTYVSSQKIAGQSVNGGSGGVVMLLGAHTPKLWVDCHKITGTYTAAINVTAGVGKISALEIEDLGHLSDGVNVSGGTLTLRNCDITILTGNGVTISAGTLRLINCVIDTTASASGNPIVVSGTGDLRLHNCVMLGASGRECVTAASGKTITAYNCFANTAVSGNITVNDGSTSPIIVGNWVK